jgi:hypothetical protein
MAFPIPGRSQLLGVPLAWRRSQAMAKWRWGPIKLRVPTPGTPGPAPLCGSQAPRGHGLPLKTWIFYDFYRIFRFSVVYMKLLLVAWPLSHLDIPITRKFNILLSWLFVFPPPPLPAAPAAPPSPLPSPPPPHPTPPHPNNFQQMRTSSKSEVPVNGDFQ